MARQVDARRRDVLLADATAVLARRGVVDTSLRTLAAEMGTSARMLIYYFGSKDALILAVLARQQRGFAPEPEPTSSLDELRKYLLADWESLTRGEKQTGVRIVEQVFGAACAQDSPYARYTADTFDRLIEALARRLVAVGIPDELSAFRAGVVVAALQGLLMRYFTATDGRTADEAFRRLIDDVALAPY